MYKLYSFNLKRKQYEDYLKHVPQGKGTLLLKQFITKEYKISPKEKLLSLLQISEKTAIIPYFLTGTTIKKIDVFVKEAEQILNIKMSQRGRNGGRSLIMRDIFNQINHKYQECPIEPVITRKTTFRVPLSTNETIREKVTDYDRSHLISDFFFDQYKLNPDSLSPSNVRLKSPNEAFVFTGTEEFFRELGRIAEDLNQKGVSKSTIFRDLLQQFIYSLENE